MAKKERIPTFEGLIASTRDVSAFASEYDAEFHKGMVVLTAMPVKQIASRTEGSVGCRKDLIPVDVLELHPWAALLNVLRRGLW